MRYQFFHIRAADPDPDTAELNAFLQAHRITGIERQFVADGQNSYWSLCVGVAEQPEAAEKGRRRSSVDYRELLSPEVFAVYAKLRALRNRLAEEQGAPPYAIFTNEQLAAMARLKNPTKTDLAQIDGVGEKRLARYTDAFLAVLRGEDG